MARGYCSNNIVENSGSSDIWLRYGSVCCILEQKTRESGELEREKIGFPNETRSIFKSLVPWAWSIIEQSPHPCFISLAYRRSIKSVITWERRLCASFNERMDSKVIEK